MQKTIIKQLLEKQQAIEKDIADKIRYVFFCISDQSNTKCTGIPPFMMIFGSPTISGAM